MKVPWTVFELQSRDTTISQNLLFSFSKGHNSKNTQSRVAVLALCTSSHVALHLCKVSWKYLQRFLSYRADTILWQTDGRTDDQGKNNMSPNPTGGDIIHKQRKYEPRHDKTNITSARIRPVWSESSLSALRKPVSLATHWAHSEDSHQTGRPV